MEVGMWLNLVIAAAAADLSEPVRTGDTNSADYGVVIGISDYFTLPDLPEAAADANAAWDTLVYTRGLPAHRVMRLDASAAREDILAAVTEAGLATSHGGRVFIYFAGHGAASPTTRERLLLGADVRPTATSFDARAVPVAVIEQLAQAGGAEVLLIVDACYAGLGRDGKALAGGSRFAVPAYAVTGGNASEWNAAGPNEIASTLAGTGHGAFSYFVFGALRGWADGELDSVRDGEVTIDEATAYVRRSMAAAQHRSQTPTYLGSTGWVISRGNERAPEAVPSSELVGAQVRTRPSGPDFTVDQDEIANARADDARVSAAQQEAAAQKRMEQQAALQVARCIEEGRTLAQAAVAKRVAVEVAAVQKDAASRWSGLKADLESCAQVTDATVRANCALTAQKFLSWAGTLSISVTGGVEPVSTSCSEVSSVPIDTIEQPVVLAEIGEVRALLLRLSTGPVAAPGLGKDFASQTLGVMKWVPPGTFDMGSPPTEPGRGSDEDQVSVTLTRGFWMMEHEVTWAQWRSLMGASPSTWYDGCDSCPVGHVSWSRAVEFAKKASQLDHVTYRLPTEAEWEFAARGSEAFVFAGSDRLADVGWYSGNSRRDTHPVCELKRNAFGLCDMSGNVWEWTSDGYNSYETSLPGGRDPTGRSYLGARVCRGGSYIESSGTARVASRGSSTDSGWLDDRNGFRLVKP